MEVLEEIYIFYEKKEKRGKKEMEISKLKQTHTSCIRRGMWL